MCLAHALIPVCRSNKFNFTVWFQQVCTTDRNADVLPAGCCEIRRKQKKGVGEAFLIHRLFLFSVLVVLFFRPYPSGEKEWMHFIRWPLDPGGAACGGEGVKDP